MSGAAMHAPDARTPHERVPYQAAPHERTVDEPSIRGLPGALPAGERVLWQGRPSWRSLVWRAYKIRSLSIYFGLVMAWAAYVATSDGGGAADAVDAALGVMPMAVVALGLLAGLAWLSVRATVYTITNRRVVIRCGPALPVTVNLPFAVVESAALRLHSDGTGDLPLETVPGQRVSYFALWPHVRPRRLKRPQPMLRAVREPKLVAALLSEALLAAAAARGADATIPTPVLPITGQAPATGLAKAQGRRPATSGALREVRA